ncbi:MAG: hypothetical protein M9921_07240 [Fimbriimonadaceae bacterium]|nr:hypothetical protein [Fimbriimonadaceae bacterium]
MKEGNQQLTPGMIALFAGVGGLVVGSVVVFAAMRNQAPKVVLPAGEPAPVASAPPAVVPDPVDPASAEDPGAAADGAGETAPGTSPTTQPSGPGAAPTVPPPTSQISGTLGPANGLPSGTDPLIPPSPDVTLREPEVRLVRLNVYTANPEEAQEELVRSLKPLGGQIRTFADYGNPAHTPSIGMLILIPEEGVEKLVNLVHAQNGNVAEQSWKTTVASRQARLEDDVQAALFDLKAQRQSLLVKYFEDATPVKEVDEAIAKIEDSIKKLHIPAEAQQRAAVKITFGPRG